MNSSENLQRLLPRSLPNVLNSKRLAGAGVGVTYLDLNASRHPGSLSGVGSRDFLQTCFRNALRDRYNVDKSSALYSYSQFLTSGRCLTTSGRKLGFISVRYRRRACKISPFLTKLRIASENPAAMTW